MRKIANNSSNNYQRSNPIPLTTNKQQISTGYSRQSTTSSLQSNTDNCISDEKPLRRIFLWNRSASKDG